MQKPEPKTWDADTYGLYPGRQTIALREGSSAWLNFRGEHGLEFVKVSVGNAEPENGYEPGKRMIHLSIELSHQELPVNAVVRRIANAPD